MRENHTCRRTLPTQGWVEIGLSGVNTVCAERLRCVRTAWATCVALVSDRGRCVVILGIRPDRITIPPPSSGWSPCQSPLCTRVASGYRPRSALHKARLRLDKLRTDSRSRARRAASSAGLLSLGDTPASVPSGHRTGQPATCPSRTTTHPQQPLRVCSTRLDSFKHPPRTRP